MRAISIVLAVFLAALPVAAQEVSRIAAHGAWGVFKDGTGADQLCWVAATAELGELPLGGDTLPPPEILILYTPSNAQLSLELRGGATPAGGEITIARERFPLFFENGWGWLSRRGTDSNVRALMETKNTAYLRVGEAGYSVVLNGFAPAIAQAEQLCR